MELPSTSPPVTTVASWTLTVLPVSPCPLAFLCPCGNTGLILSVPSCAGEGNPVGGNVTSNVSGSDVFYEEWMMYVSSDAFCLRICTADDPKNNITAALQCEQ
jgi:hypothetical protein